MSVAVMGAGAFGTALAISLCQNGPVTLWARDAAQSASMQTERINAKRLPDRPFPSNLTATSEVNDLSAADVILLAVPTQKLRALVHTYAHLLRGKSLVICCKGYELETGLGPTSVVASEVADATVAVLTGPSFAADIAAGLPTALTLACSDATTGQNLQKGLSTEVLRLYRTADTRGAELGGALKNVIAIACGAAMGARLGESARAAVMTRGFAEMNRLAQHIGAQPTTLAGLSGFGDLTLTCTSTQSRNYRLGLSFGAGDTFDPNITVEGASTALAVAATARDAEIDMPITQAVAALVSNEMGLEEAVAALLSRPLKEE